MTTTSKPTLLQLLPLLPWLESQMKERYEILRWPAPADREAFLAANAQRIEGIVTSAAHGFDDALLASLPKARVVSSFGVGLDKHDLPAAVRRGVQVGYTPDVLNDCVADLAFGLMLDVGRRLSHGDRYVRAGRWAGQPGTPASAPFPLGRQVSGANLGIVGLGRIGRTFAERASGFRMDVRYHNRRPVEGVTWQHVPQLVDLARWADFLVVITAGGAQTRHLINDAVLDALGPQGYLVNVSRGSVVDEEALVRALQAGRIAGAGLDVFDREPQVPEALFALDNVVLTPHIASATTQTRQAMGQRVLDNLDAHFDGKPLPSTA